MNIRIVPFGQSPAGILTSAIAFILLSLCAVPASAAHMVISPTRVLLGTNLTSTINVTNTGDVLTRFTVESHAWTQSLADPEIFTDSDDVSALPFGLSIPPGKTLGINVSYNDAPTDVEQAFRVVVKELPQMKVASPPPAQAGSLFGSATATTATATAQASTKPSAKPFTKSSASAKGTTQIVVLNAADIPIFVAPAGGVPLSQIPSIVGSTVEQGSLVTTLKNDGNIHIDMGSQVAFEGRDAAGKIIWSGAQHPFYVLAKSKITVKDVVPPGICSRLKSLTLDWKIPTLAAGKPPAKASATIVSCK